jgi:hypothetical protein
MMPEQALALGLRINGVMRSERSARGDYTFLAETSGGSRKGLIDEREDRVIQNVDPAQCSFSI